MLIFNQRRFKKCFFFICKLNFTKGSYSMFHTKNIIEMLNRYYASYSCRNICYAHLKCALKQGTVNIKN